MKSHQKQAAEFIKKTGHRAILADEMGLGKTRVALTCISECGESPVVVYAPNGLLTHWHNEIMKWYPGWKVITVNTKIDTKVNTSNSARISDFLPHLHSLYTLCHTHAYKGSQM